jgi:acetyl esterase
VSPIFAKDLSGLAPAFVVTAGFDPLRDEGNEYASLLADAGVEVTHICEPGMVHGYANILAIGGEARAAQLRIAQHIRSVLNPG